MFHFAGGIAFRVDIGNLFQFERPFEGDRIIDPAAEIEKVRAVREIPRQGLDLAFELERLFHPMGEMHKIPQKFFRLGPAQIAIAPPQGDGQKIEGRKLCREGLGARDTDLRTRMGIENAIRFSRDR